MKLSRRSHKVRAGRLKREKAPSNAGLDFRNAFRALLGGVLACSNASWATAGPINLLPSVIVGILRWCCRARNAVIIGFRVIADRAIRDTSTGRYSLFDGAPHALLLREGICGGLMAVLGTDPW